MKSALESVSGMKKMTRTKIEPDYKPEQSTEMILKTLPSSNFIPIKLYSNSNITQSSGKKTTSEKVDQNKRNQENSKEEKGEA